MPTPPIVPIPLVDRPGARARAVARARSCVGKGAYQLGAGGWRRAMRPAQVRESTLAGIPDSPFLPHPRTGAIGCDCSAFVLWAWEIEPHQPGFNHGSWSTVSDDANTDSIVEDALHHRAMFDLVVDRPEPGDLLVYRSIWYADGHANDTGHGDRRWIGHVSMIVGAPLAWTPGDYSALRVVQCRGPNGKRPGVIESDGYTWEHHDQDWGDVEIRRSKIVRVIGRR